MSTSLKVASISVSVLIEVLFVADILICDGEHSVKIIVSGTKALVSLLEK